MRFSAIIFICCVCACLSCSQTDLSVVDMNDVNISSADNESPMFPGGEKELQNYLDSKIYYPEEYAENCIQGRVVVGVVIQKDGSVSNIEILKGLDPGMDNMVVSVVSEMPKWEPAKKNGKNVSAKYSFTVPIKLR